MKGSVNWGDHLLNFLAVIIGVSLAFIISTNAEENKERLQFEVYMRAMAEELDDDIDTFENYQIPDNQQTVENLNMALQLFSQDAPADSLQLFLGALLEINSFHSSNTILNSLISSGKLELISDFSLQKRLLNYEDLSQELRAQGQIQLDFFMDKTLPWLMQHPSLLTGEAFSETIADPTVRSEAIVLISFYASILQGKTAKYIDAASEAKAIRDEINSYLEG